VPTGTDAATTGADGSLITVDIEAAMFAVWATAASKKTYHYQYRLFIGPDDPASLSKHCTERNGAWSHRLVLRQQPRAGTDERDAQRDGLLYKSRGPDPSIPKTRQPAKSPASEPQAAHPTPGGRGLTKKRRNGRTSPGHPLATLVHSTMSHADRTTQGRESRSGSDVSLTGKLPVPPLIGRSASTISVGYMPGVHGQDLMAAGLAPAVLLAACEERSGRDGVPRGWLAVT